MFIYKEDFNKFLKALTEAVDYVKTDLMPDFDFDAYNHDQVENEGEQEDGVPEVAIAAPVGTIPVVQAAAPSASEEVDKW